MTKNIYNCTEANTGLFKFLSIQCSNLYYPARIMDLSIIITHYQTPELLDLCLDSIIKATKDIKKEIIVVDSESREDTRHLIKEKYKQVRILPFRKNVGYAKLVNAGLRKVKGEFILILNADIIVTENSIDKMLDFLRRHPEIGIIGPRLMDFTGKIQISCFANPTLGALLARRTILGKTRWGRKKLSEFVLNEACKKVNRPLEVDWLQGSAIMIKRCLLDKIGYLDENFFIYFEDADWCRRCWQAGKKVIYFPSAKMFHYYHRASKKWGGFLDLILNKYTRIHLISALKYFWKYRYKVKK